MLKSTIVWISDKDLFKELLDVPSYMIDTPLVMANLLISQYIRIPLYKGLVKHEIDVEGSDEAINHFNQLIINDLEILTFTTKLIKVEEILGFTRQLQIALYRLNYKTKIQYQFDGDYMIFTPTVKGEYLYTNDHIDIDIEKMIGYKPLVDLYIEPVKLHIASSQLIYNLDLTDFNYHVIHDVVVVEVNGQTEQEVFATRAEFGMDKLLPVVSKLINLHNQPSIHVKSNNKIYLKYAAIRAYVDLYKNTIKLENYKKIAIDSNDNVILPDGPWIPGNITEIKNKIDQYMHHKKSDYFVQPYPTLKEAATARALMTLENDGIYLSVKQNNQYYVVGNIKPKHINYNISYDTKEDGVYDTMINDKKIIGLIPATSGSFIPLA